MLRSVKTLQGYTIRATDGELGQADQFLFDDQTWTIRYLVVDTGGWLTQRLVLVSPIAIKAARWDEQVIDVELTRQQIEQSPDIDADQPVSRQKEEEYFQYYNYQPYWRGTGLWGAGTYPAAAAYPVYPYAAPPAVPPPPDHAEQAPAREERGDPHLRSTREVIDYTIEASDGELGHVEDFIVDDETWSLRYLVVDTRNWLPGKKVLVAPRWISDISWGDMRVSVDLPRETIKQAPAFDPSQSISREYEARLHEHYGRPAYWDDTHRR